jgi:hypothetical protein
MGLCWASIEGRFICIDLIPRNRDEGRLTWHARHFGIGLVPEDGIYPRQNPTI